MNNESVGSTAAFPSAAAALCRDAAKEEANDFI